MNGFDVFKTHIFYHLSYPFHIQAFLFHQMNLLYPAGAELKTYRPGAGEEIQHPDILKIEPVAQNIEKSFPGEIGRRPGFEAYRQFNPPTPVFSPNYPQLINEKRLIYL